MPDMEKLLALIAKHRRIAYPLAGLVIALAVSGGALAATGTSPDGTSTSPTASGSTQPSPSGRGLTGEPAAGGAVNIVQVSNTTDNSKASSCARASRTRG